MKKSTILLWALLLLTLCFIWGNSLVPAEGSSALSDFVRRIVAAIFGGSEEDPEEVSSFWVRKLMHFSEFAALGAELTLLCRKALRERLFLTLFCGLGAAFVDETIQLFSEGRAGQIRDVWIDFGGCVLGISLVSLILALRRRRRASHPA